MEDRTLVELYWARDPRALSETAAKYGTYCREIARNILGSVEDAAECVNDTYLHAWNSIPPNRPAVLSAYLGKITRNLAFNRFRRAHAGKRGGHMNRVLEELEDCASHRDVENEAEKRDLIRAVNSFLDTLPKTTCSLFLCRYWYAFPVSELADRFGMTQGSVSASLHRVRKKLKKYLKERGFDK